jgi:hypothetical protein
MSRFQAEVLIEIDIDDAELPEGEDAQFKMAHQAVDVLLQRAWDTDRGRHHVNRNWHFVMLEDAITVVDEIAGDPVSVVD